VIGVFLILVFEADVKTARASEDVAIFLASFTYSGCIHDWQELLHIIDQHLVEQSLIPFLITNKKQTNKPSPHEKSHDITCLEVHCHLLVVNKAEIRVKLGFGFRVDSEQLQHKWICRIKRKARTDVKIDRCKQCHARRICSSRFAPGGP
jgi:hypothetical protein